MKTIATLKGIALTSVRGTPEAKPRDVSITTGLLGVIVAIEGTPGQWYLQTLAITCRENGIQPIAIDFGQRWILDNPNFVVDAVSKEIGRLLEDGQRMLETFQKF